MNLLVLDEEVLADRVVPALPKDVGIVTDVARVE